MNIFNNVKPKSFNWIRDSKQSIGFVAQDIESLLPEDGLFSDLVHENKDYQPDVNIPAITIKTVDYSRMSCILWSVVKSQQQRIIDLDARITVLENK